jgi:hypothetical protein
MVESCSLGFVTLADSVGGNGNTDPSSCAARGALRNVNNENAATRQAVVRRIMKSPLNDIRTSPSLTIGWGTCDN